MNIRIILAHPRPTSFCHALAQSAANTLVDVGHLVEISDLYAEQFDPVLRPQESQSSGADAANAIRSAAEETIAGYRDDLTNADGLIIIHPNWWGKPPAILCGWIDRVMVPGVAYDLDAETGLPFGLLTRIKGALVLNTSDTPPTLQAPGPDPLEVMWRDSVFAFCNVSNVRHRLFSSLLHSSQAERECWLEETGPLATEFFGAAGW
ncbi:MAG: NAD(P)H-dependent oxidoreductase [Pseudomonadota bacterium]